MQNDNNIRTNIDDVLASNVRDLERLARFYHQREMYQRAQEIVDVLEAMQATKPATEEEKTSEQEAS
jgi:hypothetical protein